MDLKSIDLWQTESLLGHEFTNEYGIVLIKIFVNSWHK